MTKKAITKKLKFFYQGFNHLLWPAVCINCRQKITEQRKDLCPECTDQILASTRSHYCPHCGRNVSMYGLLEDGCPACIDFTFHFDAIARLGTYEDALRKTVLSLKHQKTELVDHLSGMANAVFSQAHFFPQIDFIVPVPLHWTRRLSRGYNQSLLIAKKLYHPSARISIDLVRIKKTKPQPVMVTAQNRARNVADAFAARRDHRFANKTICLVDDIKTSGATLNECAKTLKQAGAKKVFAFALTVAGQNPGY